MAAASPIFAGINQDRISKLCEEFPSRSFERESLIIRQGEKAHRVYLLLEGKVEVFYLSKLLEKVTIIFHEAPFIFGEVEIWDRRPYLANVKAIEKSVLQVMTRQQYLTLLRSSHQVSTNLVQLLSALLYETGEDRRTKFFGRVEHLLANTICSYAKLYGEPFHEGIKIRKKINKTELADILGVSRKSVLRSFGKLLNEKLIEVHGSWLVIPNLELLKVKAFSL